MTDVCGNLALRLLTISATNDFNFSNFCLLEGEIARVYSSTNISSASASCTNSVRTGPGVDEIDAIVASTEGPIIGIFYLIVSTHSMHHNITYELLPKMSMMKFVSPDL